jgi:TDG/mug DNA glycosylase family protein
VARSSAAAAELTAAELADGGRQLVSKLERERPRWLAVLGIGAYRTAFAQPKASIGRQEHRIGPAGVWVLPNPSGLNAHYQPSDLARLFAELRDAVG